MKTGILLVNLGTPSAPTASAVRTYLRQFLSDRRVIDVPRWLWALILNGAILPFRSPRVAKLYQSIWTAQGSPLLAISREQQQKLQQRFTDGNIIVELGMTYGEPSIQSAVDNLIAQAVGKIIVLPLYPQYSSTTTASVFDAFAASLKQHRYMPEIAFIHHYHNHPNYITALANSIGKLNDDELLLFSFHGIPQRYADEGDIYPQHCQQTAQAVATALGLSDTQWRMTFQSRFGKEPWLQPYTDVTLEQLAKAGKHKRIAVICPGFSVDCLETLEEIAEENRDIFIANGGEHYRYIPTLNARDDHISMMETLVDGLLSQSHHTPCSKF
ncbi:ferrochelatase [Pasteurellaceae bacterium HPA106]|uniref:ferrochelatase n=1 Tax=Spirabiliibacterium pneumoniae TaxID=221400 RepID=UPI001AAE0EED|nr:ferrochelatase [Spirabiliibacterium pneumoniae]MBE2896231.1 ferrochelatase [Spirabiliibacterium pneumoniae]